MVLVEVSFKASPLSPAGTETVPNRQTGGRRPTSRRRGMKLQHHMLSLSLQSQILQDSKKDQKQAAENGCSRPDTAAPSCV